MLAAGRGPELMEWQRPREESYSRIGVDGVDLSWSDAYGRFVDDGELRESPLNLGPVAREDPDWPFDVGRAEVRAELIAGVDRTSSYAERVEWVRQHLDDPLVRPSTAPCNASWSMLVWAMDNRKEFFQQQRQVMSKKDENEREAREMELDAEKYLKLIEGFECFRKLDERVGDWDVYRGSD